jgi:hypothetical protein
VAHVAFCEDLCAGWQAQRVCLATEIADQFGLRALQKGQGQRGAPQVLIAQHKAIV